MLSFLFVSCVHVYLTLLLPPPVPCLFSHRLCVHVVCVFVCLFNHLFAVERTACKLCFFVVSCLFSASCLNLPAQFEWIEFSFCKSMENDAHKASDDEQTFCLFSPFSCILPIYHRLNANDSCVTSSFDTLVLCACAIHGPNVLWSSVTITTKLTTTILILVKISEKQDIVLAASSLRPYLHTICIVNASPHSFGILSWNTGTGKCGQITL